MIRISRKIILFLLALINVPGAYALYCEKAGFDITAYKSHSIVEGYIVAKPKTIEEVEEVFSPLLCAEGTVCSQGKIDINKFYNLYLLVEGDYQFFITKSYSDTQLSGVINLKEVQFPELDLGSKYILFLASASGKDDYYISPCAVIPLSTLPQGNEYFFEESPDEILTTLRLSLVSSEEERKIVKQTSLSGFEYRVIDLGVQEAVRKQLNLSNYKITLFKDSKKYVVVFSNPEASTHQFGSPKGTPTLEVVIDCRLNIINSYFAR